MNNEQTNQTQTPNLPDGWRVARLGDNGIAKTSSGGTPNRAMPDYFGGKIKWVKSGELVDNWIYDTEEKITPEGLKHSSAKVFPTGTLLIALYGATAGKTAILQTEAATNQAVCAIFPQNGSFDCQFLQFQLIHTRPRILNSRSGGAQPNISQRVLSSIEIVLPPLPEQRAIARALRAVQEAKEARQRELTLERERKAALMQYLFTHGTRGEARKQTEIGEIPESWRVSELGEVSEIVYGVQAAVAHLLDESKGIPILTNINITNEGTLDLSTLRYYELPEKKRESLILQRGDLLFNWRSGSKDHVGKTALFDLAGEFTFSSFILRLRPTGVIDNSYLRYFLYFIKAQWFFSQRRQQSSINSVFNASVAAKTPVAVPTLPEQNEIAAVLQACDNKIDLLGKESSLLEELFKAMLEELMTGRLRAKF